MLKYKTLLLAALLVTLVACSGVSINMPAITDAPTDTRLAGKVVWHELITDTPEESQRFYTELFGWEFQDVGLNLGFSRTVNYTLIRNQGRLIGGFIDQNLLATEADISQWVVLLSVADIDAAVGFVETSGGTVFSPPRDMAERGRMAVVADPQGALLSLLEARGGDPLDTAEADIGGFLWNELWTSDVDAATEFYQGIADYSVDDRTVTSDEGSHNYRVLKTADVGRVGILPNPIEGLAPLWATYIRVADDAALDAMVDRVEALGGSILLAPQDRDIGGRVALIADPSGAGIAIQTWPEFGPDEE